jgi:putative NADH-flavin reductase
MDIALFGAGGTIGSRIASEAEARGHHVTRLRSADADVTDPAAVAHAIAGHDATVSAVGSLEDLDLLSHAAEALLTGADAADVARLVVVGGAGNLEVAPGQRLVDAPEFPAAYVAALDLYRANETVDWTSATPANCSPTTTDTATSPPRTTPPQ